LPEILPSVRKLLSAGVRPGRLLTELNRIAAQSLPYDRFITAAALELDAEVCTLTMANAGHVPALTRSEKTVRIVGRASGPPLGIAPNAGYFEECVPFKHGDTVVLMTDGVLEAVESDLCEMHTLQTLLATAPLGAAGVHRWISEVVDRCLQGRRADDVTLLCIDADDVELMSLPNLRRAS